MKGSSFLMKLYLHYKINVEYSVNFTKNFTMKYDEHKRKKNQERLFVLLFLNFFNHEIKKNIQLIRYIEHNV